ncbi:MAG: helix-hairpin-helix domain-containing protein, partial [Bifidobacteriaceae bacterium]|nr:helix-hairpin-helix domain-containing protein [Bifidobacteriaceae bacterium]
LEELQSVKGIGPVTAQKILDYRKRYGYFKSVEQLLEISGIGNKTFQKIQQHVRVS